jgi:galactokinase
MTSAWHERVRRLALDPDTSAEVVRRFEHVDLIFEQRFPGSAPARAWWVPGRIEVLGKHTDYGGGRSLLATLGRGIHWIAAPARDERIEIVDASTDASCEIALSADVPHRPGHWSDYVISVARRIARDFPGADAGMRAVFSSSLPKGAGLSSSSALVVATFLPLAAFNRLEDHPAWQQSSSLRRAEPSGSAIHRGAGYDDSKDALAGYLGAIESGRAFGRFPADHGVGTQGGSEDHTAILCCRAGQLSVYRFRPVAHEGDVALPDGWTFAIAVSGVHASKSGAVRDHYNRLSAQMARLTELSRDTSDVEDESLLAAIESGAGALERLRGIVASSPDADMLLPRLDQFSAESIEIIPAVAKRLSAGDVAGIGPLIDRSQRLAEETLANQVPETMTLVRSARDLGAAAASAFGAGFGGAVWALVRRDDLSDFLRRWRTEYLTRHPDRAARAELFGSDPGPAATEL